MIPHATRGASFKGLSAYLLNNTAEQAPDEPNRVAWAETENLAGLEAEDAWRVMAMTAQNADTLKQAAGVAMTGAKSSGKPVYHYSLSWAKDETPDDAHMRQTARESVAMLGLHDHQWMMVRHTDKDHAHVHIMINLVHGETGKTAHLSFDHSRLSAWAGRYEREHGIKCPLRLENEERRARGEKTKYQSEKRDYSAQVTKAWQRSDSGRAFLNALDGQGLALAKGTRKSAFVIVDGRGEVQALDRQLDLALKGRAKGKAIREKLAGLELPDGSELARQIKEERKHSREAQDSDSQGKMLAAADAKAEKLAAVHKEQERRAERHAAHLDKVLLRQSRESDELAKRLDNAFVDKLEALETETARFKDHVEGKGVMRSLRRIWRGEKDKTILADLRSQKAAIDDQCVDSWMKLIDIHSKEIRDLKHIYDQKKQRFADLETEKKIQILDRLKSREISRQKGEAGKLAPAKSHAGRPQHIDTAKKQRERKFERVKAAVSHADWNAEQKRLTQARIIAQRSKAAERQQEIKRAEPQRGTVQYDDARKQQTQDRIDKMRDRQAEKGRDKGRDLER